MAGEVAFALQRCREQRADAIGQFDDLVLRVRRSRTAAGDDDRTLRGDQLLDHRRQQVGAGRFHARRQELRRGSIFVVPVEVFFLQVHRQVQHHRSAADARRVERLGDFLGHVVDAGDGEEPRAARLDEAALVHRLRAVLGPGLDFACDQHQRRLAAIGRDERGAALRQAWPAGDHRDADLAGGAGVAVGHRHGHGLVARIVRFDRGIAAQRAPQPHVAVAHQAKEVRDPLGNQGLRNRFVDFHRRCFLRRVRARAGVSNSSGARTAFVIPAKAGTHAATGSPFSRE